MKLSTALLNLKQIAYRVHHTTIFTMAAPLVITATCSEPFSALRRVQVKLNDEQEHSENVRKVTDFVKTSGVTSFDVLRVDSCTVDVLSLVRTRGLPEDYF